MARVNQINIGDLYDVKEVFYQGLSEEYQVNGKFRNLQQILLKMAQFYLSINNYRKDKFDWFGGRGEGAFKVALGLMGLRLVRMTKL